NLTDALSSTITIIGTKLSNKKPDQHHPFGHGRIEYITSLFISILVLLAGAVAVVESIEGFFKPDSVSSYTIPSIIIISAAVLVKVALGIYFRARGKKLNSQALVASGVDALMDSILSFSTLVVAVICLLVDDAKNWHLESYVGIVIGLFIIKAGIDILRDAISEIIGKRTSSDLNKSFKAMILEFDEVKGVYDLILNNYGPEKLIGSVHIEVRDDITARELDILERDISAKAYEDFGTILTIGIYATNDTNDHHKQIRTNISKTLQKHNEIVQMHGFYVNERLHLIQFDLVFKFESKDPAATVEIIKKEIKELYPDYESYIVIDTDFTD
ncbi:MAG: cation transporter, partial [Bacilli bacterium]|nr:cation transporter [Bacilli bacterium]